MEQSNHDLVEARMIIGGLTGLLPTRAHLVALDEHHEIQLVRIANQLDALKEYVLNLD